MRSLVQTAVTGRLIPRPSVKRSLFTLIPEFAVAAFDAASFASQAKVIVSLPNDTFALDQTLLQMLYLDMLVFGFATFEVMDASVLYADPTQFTISLRDDGSPKILLPNDEDVTDRVGCIPFCPEPNPLWRQRP